jgi:hypothetical protein
MTQKIRIYDQDRIRDCIKWLIKEVGPVKNSMGGPAIAGEGWSAYKVISSHSVRMAHSDHAVFVEVNDHVDEDIQLLFVLKWS